VTPFALEVLCTLPEWREQHSYVTLNDMKEDFGLPTQAQLADAMKEIEAAGIHLVRDQAHGERRVGVHTWSWKKAREMAQEYWRRERLLTPPAP
jgi:hypothetical protein